MALWPLVGLPLLKNVAPRTLEEALAILGLTLLLGVFILSITALLVRLPGAPRASAALGRHSLGIYLLHVPVITLLNLWVLLPLAPLLTPWFTDSLWLQRLFPLGTTLLVLGVCVLGSALLRRTPSLAWTLGLPPELWRRLEQGLRRGREALRCLAR